MDVLSQYISHLICLKKLSVAGNQITNTGLGFISKSLSSITSLTELHISNNFLGEQIPETNPIVQALCILYNCSSW